jgi:hypothetical protein
MYTLQLSPRSDKKWRITTPSGKNVDFGASGYSDFSLHHNPDRKESYISRHANNEDWTVSGINTAGFWSRWLLWNLPSFKASVRDIEKTFGIKIDTTNIRTNSDGSPIN